MPNFDSVVVRSFAKCLGWARRSFGGKQARRAASRPALVAAAAAAVETLENRQHMSVSMVNGWTDINPGPGARVIYVSSSSGSDSNSGLSSGSPVKSIAKAKKLFRNGAGDQMLLKRGDTFNTGFGFWEFSGKNASQPAVIGAYGSGARPHVFSGGENAIHINPKGVHDVAVIGIHLDGNRRGGKAPDGIVSAGRTSNFLIEDVKVEAFRNNLNFQSFHGKISNLKVRRSEILDSYSKGSHSQGIFADGVAGILLEENIFDHNGWGHGAPQTMFNHNAYITGLSSGLVARGNVFANAASHGLQARPGGDVQNNLFFNNGVGLTWGLVNGAGYVKAGGVTGTVSGNVFIGGHAIAGRPAGVGISISNVKSGNVSDNVFVAGDPGAVNPAILLDRVKGTANAGQAVGINNLTIANNVVYKWNQAVGIGSGMSIKNVAVRNNDFQNITAYQAVQNRNPAGTGGQSWSNNRYHVPGNAKSPILVRGKSLTIAKWGLTDAGAKNVKVGYADPGRSVSSYAGDFIAKARNLSGNAWDTRYTAAPILSYLRAGFNKGSSSVKPPTGGAVSVPEPAPAPTAPTAPVRDGTGPSVSVNDLSVVEGNSGTKAVRFTVSLSGASGKPVSVNWETKTNTAKVGADYVGRNGTLTFKAGETSKTITIQVIGDRKSEANEKFALNLLGVKNGKIGDGQGWATIVDG